jgi:predicted nuclease of predicted toxin-antitoxin system
MKFLLDMNLPPRWVQFLSDHGFKCVHWSNAGEYTAKDTVIMAYAREHGYTVFTILALFRLHYRGTGPSVFKYARRMSPEAIGDLGECHHR